MAENVAITPGVGDVVGADDIGGVKYQRIKMIVGADGTNDGDVSSANPLPVDLGANNDVTVTGTVDLGATDNAVLDTIAGDTTSLDSKVTACNTGAVVISSGTVTANLSATDNAVLDTIDAVLDTIKTDTAALVVDAAASEVLLGTIDADTSTIAGNTTSIDSKITACNTGAIAGTVTANLSATDNAVLDTIDAVLDTIKTDTAALVVDAAASEALLTTIDADTGAIKTAVETLDNAISGTEMQVDVVAPLPAGTNAIGKLAANSGVDIGDVDVLSLPALAAGTNSIGQVQPTKFPTTDDAEYMNKYYTSAGATTDGIIWSPAAGKRWYVTDLIINVSAAATVTLEDDLTAGDSPVLKCELAANGGFCKRFATPLASGEDAADLTITTTAGNVYVTAVGYEV